MYEVNLQDDHKSSKLRNFFTANNTSWIIFGIIILVGIIIRLFLWDFTSTDMNVWRDAANQFLAGDNPYKTTLESFQNGGMKHFYAYFPFWMYICSFIILIFPDAWFFGVVKGLILLFDIQVIILLYSILKPKIKDTWRLKIPIAIWFVTPVVLVTSSMHGKFDSLMLIFILLACIAYEEKCFAYDTLFLSFAILTKPIALIFIPFFFKNELLERNAKMIVIKLFLLFIPILLVSIPFLSNPVVYIQGVLGVHVTREYDMGPLFLLFSLMFQSLTTDKVIRIILTILIILMWIILNILYYVRNIDIYNAIFFTFLAFNALYWVFLVQYIVWIYTFYIIVTTKSRKKHWYIGVLTSSLIIFSTTLLALLGVFVKNGL